MEFKPGDILYRKYSDKSDLYCVIVITNGPFNVGLNVKFVHSFSYYSFNTVPKLTNETIDAAANWYIQVDLNNYDIKEKFITKIKEFLVANLGKVIAHDTILDNLLYIEILDALKKYEIKEEKDATE